MSAVICFSEILFANTEEEIIESAMQLAKVFFMRLEIEELSKPIELFFNMQIAS